MKPKLRFKEFSGEWKNINIGLLGTIITGSTPSTNDITNYGNEYMFVGPGDMGLSKYINKTEKMLSKKGFNSLRKVKKGSIMVTCIGSTIGKIGIANQEMTTNQQINSIIVNNIYNNEFIYYTLIFNFPKYMNAIGVQAVPILNKSEFEKLKIMIPSLPEQSKIADFLSNVDKKIQNQQDKITHLENIKKGFMQKIFSREIRFKDYDGNEFPEWKEKKLGDVGYFYNGLSGKNKDDFDVGNSKFITYMNVYKNTIAEKTMLQSVNIKEGERQNIVEYGDILFTQSSETIEEIGFSSVWLGENRYYLNSFCFGFRFKKEYKVNPVFMGYLFRSQLIRKKIKREGQGSTRFNLSSNRLEKIKIYIPCLEEQRKIADFLLSFDEKIDVEKDTLEHMKEIKKGLLQQMFV